jgi:sugar phosphate isomerase/epimerase
MYKSLGPGAIGIRDLALPSAINLARATGFAGLEINIREIKTLSEVKGIFYIKALFDEAGVRPSHWGLPVAWRDEGKWQHDLAELPALAKLAQNLDCVRTTTWCPPASDVSTYVENFAWHQERFGAIAAVLAEYDCKLGIEFIGPQTLRDGHKFPFIYTLEGMMELAQAIGTGNVGLLLDVWHLYTSGGDAHDIEAITAEDVVLVHVNDAPAGVAREAQIDSIRCLPMETGVVDAPAMLQKLSALGYDGPVMVEPFSQALNAIAKLDAVEAARRTMGALNLLWAASGL